MRLSTGRELAFERGQCGGLVPAMQPQQATEPEQSHRTEAGTAFRLCVVRGDAGLDFPFRRVERLARDVNGGGEKVRSRSSPQLTNASRS